MTLPQLTINPQPGTDMNHRPHFPIQILTHQGGLIIIAAANNHSEIGARLPADYVAAADTLCQKVTKDNSDQKTAKGELGNLTAQQQQSLVTLHHSLSQAQKTAKLAFFGQTVKLHQEFQIGAHGQNDLASFLSRCDTVLASLQNTANAPILKLKGWTDAETTAFQTARDTFGPANKSENNPSAEQKTAPRPGTPMPRRFTKTF